MGSGHRSGRPEGRTAPPRGSRQPPRGWPGSSRPAAACEPTGRAAEEAFHHPANEPAVTKTDPARSTSADSPTAAGPWCLQSGRARGGFAGPPCPPRIAQEPPQVRHVIMGSLARHGFAIAETDIRVSLASVSGWCWLEDVQNSVETRGSLELVVYAAWAWPEAAATVCRVGRVISASAGSL